MIGLLVEIANRIGAQVQGDDGEFYESRYLDLKFLEELRDQKKFLSSKEDTTDLDNYIESLSEGAILLHRKFGQGTILELSGEGIDKEFVIYFESIKKSKRILAYHSPIISPDNNLL